MSDAPESADLRCKCCGANRDGSFEIEIAIVGECDCAAKAPTVPVYRDANDHLPDCRMRQIGRLMIRRMAADLSMRAEVTER